MHGVSCYISNTTTLCYCIYYTTCVVILKMKRRANNLPVHFFLEGREGIVSTENFQYVFWSRSNVGQDL